MPRTVHPLVPLLLGTLVLGCGSKTTPATGDGPDAASAAAATTGTDAALSVDHDPDLTGKTRRYEWTQYQPDGSVFKAVRFVETYTPDGKRRHRDEKQKGENVEDYRRRVNGDDVQHAVAFNSGPRTTGLAWLPRIKAGVKPGATWEFVPASGAKVYWPYNVTGGDVVRAGGEPSDRVRWTYREVGSDRGRPCAVVVEEYLDAGVVQESWVRWHVRGEGVVRQEYHRRTKGGAFVRDRMFVYEPATVAVPGEAGRPAAKAKEMSKADLDADNAGLQKLERDGLVVHYKGFTEGQMAAFVDAIIRAYVTGKEPRRMWGFFGYQAQLAKIGKGMKVVREGGFTRVYFPVQANSEAARRQAKERGIPAPLPVQVGFVLMKIDEGVRGHIGYATCDEDWTTIYAATENFGR